MQKASVPKATLGRLPQYLQYLRELSPEKTPTISATSIAKNLSLGEVQVRKDLNAVSGAGRPKVGYETAELIRHLEQVLGSSECASAVLVGAGKLGRALLEYDSFEAFGVKIAAAFDCNEQSIRLSNQKEILPMNCFEEYCKTHHTQIGIITTGPGSAQEVCDRMVSSGIAAIWNFAPCKLELPKNIRLKQENLALSLAYLNNQLINKSEEDIYGNEKL